MTRTVSDPDRNRLLNLANMFALAPRKAREQADGFIAGAARLQRPLDNQTLADLEAFVTAIETVPAEVRIIDPIFALRRAVQHLLYLGQEPLADALHTATETAALWDAQRKSGNAPDGGE